MGCTHPPTPQDTGLYRSAQFQNDIDNLLLQNAQDKKWEIIYLDQINLAIEHNDTEALEFFTEEHSQLDLVLPEWLKKEIGYMPSWNEELNLK